MADNSDICEQIVIQPTGDRVLVRRIDSLDEKVSGRTIILTDEPKGIKGIVLAVGPGKRDEDGEIVPLGVEPGDVIYFNSKWNDFSNDDYHHELSLGHDERLHLIREDDIFGIVT